MNKKNQEKIAVLVVLAVILIFFVFPLIMGTIFYAGVFNPSSYKSSSISFCANETTRISYLISNPEEYYDKNVTVIGFIAWAHNQGYPPFLYKITETNNEENSSWLYINNNDENSLYINRKCEVLGTFKKVPDSIRNISYLFVISLKPCK